MDGLAPGPLAFAFLFMDRLAPGPSFAGQDRSNSSLSNSALPSLPLTQSAEFVLNKYSMYLPTALLALMVWPGQSLDPTSTSAPERSAEVWSWASQLAEPFILVPLAICILCTLILGVRALRKSGAKASAASAQRWRQETEDEALRSFRSYLKTSDVDMSELGTYKPWAERSVESFRPMLKQTQCLFARKATVWGSRPWSRDRTIEENTAQDLDTLRTFLRVGKGLHLDGFVFEIPFEDYGDTLAHFAETVRRLLRTISDNDPSGVRCMRKTYIGQRGWHFEYDEEPIFVTTFAPCYPHHNSRFNFGLKSSFVLLQPEFSFAWRDIGNDTKDTQWDNPETMRDKIRVEFKKEGRPYEIPPTVFYSPALFVVKPALFGAPTLEWWKDDGPNQLH